MIIWLGSDFGKEFTVYVGFFVNFDFVQLFVENHFAYVILQNIVRLLYEVIDGTVIWPWAFDFKCCVVNFIMEFVFDVGVYFFIINVKCILHGKIM